jgi:hypothetical protein
VLPNLIEDRILAERGWRRGPVPRAQLKAAGQAAVSTGPGDGHFPAGSAVISARRRAMSGFWRGRGT